VGARSAGKQGPEGGRNRRADFHRTVFRDILPDRREDQFLVSRRGERLEQPELLGEHAAARERLGGHQVGPEQC